MENKKDMEEQKLKNAPGKNLDKAAEATLQTRPNPSGAPWWLVFVLVLMLLGMAFYIAWMNSAEPKNRLGFLAYLMSSGDSETQVLAPISAEDSLAIWENSMLSSNSTGTDSTAEGWKTDASITNQGTDTAFRELQPVQAAFAEPLAEPAPTESKYYIKAGEFKSKSSALFRIRELRQGNYKARVIEPDSVGGNYIVSAGEFTSYNKAKEQAKTIGFIMDIRTSVVRYE